MFDIPKPKISPSKGKVSHRKVVEINGEFFSREFLVKTAEFLQDIEKRRQERADHGRMSHAKDNPERRLKRFDAIKQLIFHHPDMQDAIKQHDK